MKKTLLSLLFLTVTFFVCDRLFDVGLWWMHEKSGNLYDTRRRHIVEETRADMILMGASRTNHHFVPQILEDSLGLTVYNAGFDGSGDIFFQYAELGLLLGHHTPKYIVLEMGSMLLMDHSKNVGIFAPYIGRSADTDSVFSELGLMTGYRLCRSYRYNSCVLGNIFGMIGGNKGTADRGYLPLPYPGKPLAGAPKQGSVPYPVDTLALTFLDRFVRQCHGHGVHLLFCMSPLYQRPFAGEHDFMKAYAAEHGIPFLDYHTDLSYQDAPELWKDAAHLWSKGAELFSRRFASDVKVYL